MRTVYQILFIAIIIFGAGRLSGQKLDTFSVNQSAFLSELETLMTMSKNEAQEEAYKKFAEAFRGGLFSDLESEAIRLLANTMLARRMTASSHFLAYLKVLPIVKQQGRGEERFKDWHNVLARILADDDRKAPLKFLEYVRFSEHFFEQGLLHASKSAHNWLALTDEYELGFRDSVPVVNFEQLDLMCFGAKDSIVIAKTIGAFFPLDHTWVGKGGTVSWERYEEMEDVYAELDDYTIKTTGGFYHAENAQFHYPQFFGSQRVIGKLEDKMTPLNSSEQGTYPRFESDQQVLEINNIGQGIAYTGGFRLRATTVYGYGTKEAPAKLELSNDKKQRVFTGAAQLFTIRRGEVITGQKVNASLFFCEDAITHPSVHIRFDIAKRELTLTRGDSGSELTPFYDSYHMVNITSPSITAFIEKDSVVIGRKNVPYSMNDDVSFESYDFFNPSDYYRVQNIATANPIAIMKVKADQLDSKRLKAETIAQSINPRYTAENIQSLLYHLVTLGFINYDSEQQVIEIKDKVFHYVEADQGQVDYDGLLIRSNTDSTSNAYINLKNQTLHINGVRPIEFSTKQRVALQPKDNRLIMKGNRNLDFAGKLFAGFSTIEGKDFHFDYNRFQVKLDSVKYFDLFIHNGRFDKDQKPLAYGINSRIENLNGYLLIDAPSNKAGMDEIKMFPSLQSKNTSYVYYDREDTQEGSYLRDSFYFELKPFSFNHLDAFTARDIRFEGQLVSADIFPSIEETLVLQEDGSLGFDSKTPETGLPIYQQAGNYTGNIGLSNSGLKGKGTLQYLGAYIDSEDLVFRPRQTTGTADEFNLEESAVDGLEVPQVRGEAVSIDWRPYQDSMYIKSESAPFAFFKEDNHTLKGTLILTPDGVRGDGRFDWDKATLSSDLFSFGTFSVDADTSSVDIKTLETGDLALQTADVISNVDFKEEIGRFKANDPLVETFLPYNRYKTSMNEFEWDMNKEGITFLADENHLGTFTSTDKSRDSLLFEGYQAYYDLKTNNLLVGGVPHIVAADAFIYPDSNQVEIQAGGLMTTLENARIVADTLNQNHVINRATVKIEGRKNYTAKGFYEYNIADKEQEIEFSDIVGRPMGGSGLSNKGARVITTAAGEVKAEDNFFIDHKTAFQGRISLSADSKTLDFSGFARLEADKLPERHWFSIKSKGDKKDLVIQYEKPTSDEGFWLYTGLFLSKQTAVVYPVAMMPPQIRQDRNIFPATGVFKYLEDKDQFVFGDSSKVILNERRGNRFIFDNKDGSALAEGKFSLASGLKYISVDAAGRAATLFPPPAPEVKEEAAPGAIMSADEPLTPEEAQAAAPPAPESYPVDAEFMMGIKFIFPEPLLRMMTTDIISSSFDADIIAYLADLEFYQNAASNLFPPSREVDEFIEATSMGFLEMPKKVNPYTFLFSKLKMKWNPQFQSWISMEDKVGVAAINGEAVNKKLKCLVECKMPSNEDDRIYVYIESPSGSFYFFGYKQGILSVASDNTKFMDEVLKLKASELVQKMDDGETYEILPEETGTARVFLRRIEAARKQ